MANPSGVSLAKSGGMQAAGTRRFVATANGPQKVPGKVFASKGDFFAHSGSGGTTVTHAPTGRAIRPEGIFGLSRAGASQLVRTLNHPDVQAVFKKAAAGDRQAGRTMRELVQRHAAHHQEKTTLAAMKQRFG